MGPKYVVIKKGEHGALIFHEDKMFYAPAMPLAEVFDPTVQEILLQEVLQVILAKTGDISFESMKRAIIYGSCIGFFLCREIWNRTYGTSNQKEDRLRYNNSRA